MADTENKVEASKQEVTEATVADAPKKNAVAAEPSKIASMSNYEDLGAAVVKPTDSNPDATKKSKKVSDAVNSKADDGDASGKPDTSAGTTKVAHPGQSMKAEEGSVEDETLSEKEVKEGEMPPEALKALKKSKEDKKDMSASYKKEEAEEDTLDVSDDVKALIGDEDLTEEFKQKAATIFEAAIRAKLKAEKEKIDVKAAEKLKEDTDTFKQELVGKVDSYLNYVVEEWMKNNELAVEKGIKGEIAEDFISGLKKLFEDHYIDVPDEKYDVLEDQASKIEELEKKLNEQIEKNVELNQSNSELTKQDIVDELASDLADTNKEKFNKLAEEVDYTNAEEYRNKVKTIKESYFGSKEVSSKDEIDTVATDGDASNVDLSNAMAAYTAAISKTKDRIKIGSK
tara:strand:+ start:3121 stop:4320 length:1200 start_codon:yes stop_codon:yes gene_type:complete